MEAASELLDWLYIVLHASRYLTIIKNRTEALKQLTEELFRYSIVNSTLQKLTKEELISG